MLDPYLLYLEKPTRERYDQFVLRYWLPVERLVKRLVASSDLANDVLQETFLRLARSKKRPDAIENPRAYVLGAAFRLVREQARKAETRERHESQASRSTPTLHPSASDIVVAREGVEKLHAALNSLPPPMRAAMHLLAIEGLSHREISLVTGSSEDAVRAQVSRARKRLRALLGKGYTVLALMHLKEVGHSALPSLSGAVSPRRLPARAARTAGAALLAICMATVLFLGARGSRAPDDFSATPIGRVNGGGGSSGPPPASDIRTPLNDPASKNGRVEVALSAVPQLPPAKHTSSEHDQPATSREGDPDMKLTAPSLTPVVLALGMAGALAGAELGDINGDSRISPSDAYLYGRWQTTGLDLYKPVPGSDNFEDHLQCTQPPQYASLVYMEAIRRVVPNSLPHFIEVWPESSPNVPAGALDPNVRLLIVNKVYSAGESLIGIDVQIDSDIPLEFLSIVLKSEDLRLRPQEPGIADPPDPTLISTTELYLISHGHLVFRPRVLNIPFEVGAGTQTLTLMAMVPKGTPPGDYSIQFAAGTEALSIFGDIIIPTQTSGTLSLSAPIVSGHNLPFPPLDISTQDRRIGGNVDFRVAGQNHGYPGDELDLNIELRTTRPINYIRLQCSLDLRYLDVLSITPLYQDPEFETVKEEDHFTVWIRKRRELEYPSSGLITDYYEPYRDPTRGGFVPYTMGRGQPSLKYIAPLNEWIPWINIRLKLLPTSAGQKDLTFAATSAQVEFYPYMNDGRHITEDCGTDWDYDEPTFEALAINVLGGGEPQPDPEYPVDPIDADTQLFLHDPRTQDKIIDAQPGDQVVVPLYFRSQVDLWKVRLVADYDEKLLELQEVHIMFKDFDGLPFTEALLPWPEERRGALNLECTEVDGQTTCIVGLIPFNAVWHTPWYPSNKPDILLPDGAVILDVQTVRYNVNDSRGGQLFWERGISHQLGWLVFRIRNNVLPQQTAIIGTEADWKYYYMQYWIKSRSSGYPYFADENYFPSRYDVPATAVHETIINIQAPGIFIRGDSNQDGRVDLSDGVNTLNVLFLGSGGIRCGDAADANDDGLIDITDAIYTLNHLFTGGPEPPLPFPGAGEDLTDDLLDC